MLTTISPAPHSNFNVSLNTSDLKVKMFPEMFVYGLEILAHLLQDGSNSKPPGPSVTFTLGKWKLPRLYVWCMFWSNDQQIFIVSYVETISCSSWAPFVVEARIEPSTFWPVSLTLYHLRYPTRLFCCFKKRWNCDSSNLWSLQFVSERIHVLKIALLRLSWFAVGWTILQKSVPLLMELCCKGAPHIVWILADVGLGMCMVPSGRNSLFSFWFFFSFLDIMNVGTAISGLFTTDDIYSHANDAVFFLQSH
jgi:hypothetical protein